MATLEGVLAQQSKSSTIVMNRVRDEFARSAMQALIATTSQDLLPITATPQEIEDKWKILVRNAWDCAEQMIEEKSRRGY